jgi:hypothetical protein
MKFEDLLVREEWLFLSSIADAGDNRLRAVICAGGHQRLPSQIIGKHVDEIAKMPVEYTAAPYYELVWDRYFTFMVRDESTAALRKGEEFAGHGVRLFKKSWLLAAVPDLSNGLHDLPGIRGPVKHFGLYCLNHIVDVLAYEEPVVRDLGRRAMEPRTPNQAMQPTPVLCPPSKQSQPPGVG